MRMLCTAFEKKRVLFLIIFIFALNKRKNEELERKEDVHWRIGCIGRTKLRFLDFVARSLTKKRTDESLANEYSEDEHQLIAQYCRSLNGDSGAASSTPRSPVQLLASLDSNHKEEIETMIRWVTLAERAHQAANLRVLLTEKRWSLFAQL